MALADAFASSRAHGPAVLPDSGAGRNGTATAWVREAVAAYERVRKPRVDEFQEAAFTSLVWLENVHEHLHLEPVAFAYGLMTRSRRTGYNRLKRKDPEFIAQYDS